MQTKTKFILFIVIIIVLVSGLGILNSKGLLSRSKFDDFSKALKERGAVFYGAFWCTHCQAQKKEFGQAKRYLPYVECSSSDMTQLDVCKENKIESYPTWTFKDGVKLTSKDEPLICPVKVEGVLLTGACKDISSDYYRVWSFPGYNFSIKSPTDPIRTGDIWQFPSDSQTSGELPMEFLAEQIQFTLPK